MQAQYIIAIQHIIKINSKRNRIKNTTRDCQLKCIYGVTCPQTPLAKRMASPCAACRFATCKFPNLKKKILGPPPLPNPGDAPGFVPDFVIN